MYNISSLSFFESTGLSRPFEFLVGMIFGNLEEILW